MANKMTGTACAVSLLLGFVSYNASAHIQAGRLGKNENSIMQLAVTCADNRDRLSARVAVRTRSKYLAQLNIEKLEPFLAPDQPTSVAVIDPVSGDRVDGLTGKGYSPNATLVQGPGKYIMTLSKIKKKLTHKDKKLRGKAVFNIELHCMDKNGKHSDGDTIVEPY